MSFPFIKDACFAKYSEQYNAAFFDAIRRLDLESISLFIESKPRNELMKLVDRDGNSPLHVALLVSCSQQNSLISLQQEIIQLFITLKFDEHQKNQQGVTPLDLVMQCPIQSIRELFPEYHVPEVLEVLSPEASLKVATPLTTSIEPGEEETESLTPVVPSPNSGQPQLRPSSTVEELLGAMGLQEYIDTFRNKVGIRREIEDRAT